MTSALNQQNYQLKSEQVGHYRTLVRQAREHEAELDRAEAVEKDKVEEAVREKLHFARWAAQDLHGMLH